CFPEWSMSQVLATEKAFYRNFCDILLESIKHFSVRYKDLAPRMDTKNTELFDRFHREGKHIILAGGHMGNWELWAIVCPPRIPGKVMAIYKRLSNAFFDAKMRQTRGEHGLELIPTKEVRHYMQEEMKEPTTLVFAIDQSPSNPSKALWIQFMGRETAALFGTEKYARELNCPVIYGSMIKTGRGRYAMEYHLVCENPASLEHGELTRMNHALLEADIRRNPELWLWTHRRWKHRKP
ncbi:MAG: lysophospholipid acyltransferase family protein, partial [Flavobacteriales bacterium]